MTTRDRISCASTWRTSFSSRLIRKWRQEQLSNVQCLERAIKIIKSANKKLVSSNTDVFNRLKYEFTLIKNYLQMAAARSQFNNHQKALKHGHKCIAYILRIVRQISWFL